MRRKKTGRACYIGGRSLGGRFTDVAIVAFFGILVVLSLVPFYNMVIVSLAKYEDIVRSTIYIVPKSFEFVNYQITFAYPGIINSIDVSTFVTVAGTALSLLATMLGSYALSRNNLPFRRVLFYLILFTMYFGAGLIPWYLVMKSLGFIDSIWSMMIPPLINTFYLILMKNYFSSIPDSLEESAKIDGANDFVILFRIMMPMATPILATIALFYAIDRWNDWWNAMIFIQDPHKIPLQIVLRTVLISSMQDLGGDANGTGAIANEMKRLHTIVYSRSLQMAIVTITTIPILLVYPFLQKYFTKGIMLGAIKE